jgi:hypothetical protein
MTDVDFIVSGGGDRETIEINVEDALPTVGDVLYALQRQRSRILRRTEQGVDVEGKPFAPYNSTRPYYWYPAGRVGKKRDGPALKKEKLNVARASKKLGGKTSRSGLGVRFDSYADFKSRGLGRSNPDLRGPRAPHMLQEIAVKSGSVTAEGPQGVGLHDHPTEAHEGRIGIYGDAAKRATGHNAASGRPKGMPRRQFLGTSSEDERLIAGDIQQRAGERAAGAIAGRRR